VYNPVKKAAQKLRRYEPEKVLDAISKVSAWQRKDPRGFATELAKKHLDYQVAFRDFRLAFVAKLVLHFYDRPRLSLRRFDWKDLLESCSALTGNQTPSEYPLNSREDADRFFIRIAYEQFPDFYGDADTLARTHLLFRSCARATEARMKHRFNIDEAYKEATGLTLDQSWDITMALFGLILEQRGGIQHGPFKPGNLEHSISQADLDQFIDMISLTPQQFQQKMTLSLYQVDPFETFNPNPLVNWPMIRLGDNRWVVPVLPYLFRRGTEQVFYDVIGYKGREFSSFFGYVFEDYTDRILTTLGTGYEIIPEKRYVRDGQTYDTCDRIIIKDCNAVLIECKTKRLSLQTKFTADEALLRNDLTDVGKGDDKGNLVYAIRQLYRTEHDIRANCAGLEELNQKITGSIYPVVLALDPYYFANGGYVKRIISEELAKGDMPVKDYAWQIMDVWGFEALCSFAIEADFIDLVAKKFSSPELAEQEMSTFIENSRREGGQEQKEKLVNPVLSAENAIFQRELRSRYGLKVGG